MWAISNWHPGLHFQGSVCIFYLRPALDTNCLLARIARGLTGHENPPLRKALQDHSCAHTYHTYKQYISSASSLWPYRTDSPRCPFAIIGKDHVLLLPAQKAATLGGGSFSFPLSPPHKGGSISTTFSSSATFRF